ncbi:MAG: ROK family transcriptional regulator [Bryobacteraceae bacterium]|jgi:predicted NBD/HSP70 family sugar kinase
MPVTDTSRPQGASSEDVRGINRRIVLNLIRKRQPISRADLARVSGMQRSTISLIVEQLIEEDWVLTGPTGRLPRGRRPTFLRLNDERVMIGVDIRPAQITVAVADANGRFISQEAIVTTPDPEFTLGRLIEVIRRIVASCRGRKIEGIGVSVPGRYIPGSNRLVFAPNLGWRDVDLRTPLTKATGLEVEIENAATACALAAVWFDHMEQVRNLVVVTVSEGVGTGFLLNGQIVRGLNGMAGEFGHVPLDPQGPLCGCGRRGCWEVFASNRAALRYYRESESGSEAAGLNFLDLLSLADQGDRRAEDALKTMAYYLGRGMRMLVAGFAPERIVVVGDLTRSWKRFEAVIQPEILEQVLPGGIAPQLIPAREGGVARLRGTVALVLEKDFGVCS